VSSLLQYLVSLGFFPSLDFNKERVWTLELWRQVPIKHSDELRMDLSWFHQSAELEEIEGAAHRYAEKYEAYVVNAPACHH